MDLPADATRRAMLIVGGVAFTIVAYSWSSGLQRLWWPIWFAPIAILLLAPGLRVWQAFCSHARSPLRSISGTIFVRWFNFRCG
jgi:hypothetical protein